MVLVMSGTMAAVIFPTMKQLQPVLPEFVKVPQDHWSLAAGLVMRKVFFISDAVQLVMATISVVAGTLVLKSAAIETRRKMLLVAPIVVACLAMLTSAFWLSPAMRREMDRTIIAGRDGNAIVMQEARARFNSKHPIATGLMATTFSAVVLATIVGAGLLKMNVNRELDRL